MSENVAVSDWYVYGAIALLALCSVVTRAGYQVFGDYLPLPDGVRRALRYAPAAALTAIVIPDLLPWRAGLGPQFDLKLLAGIAAVAVFLRTRSAMAVIVAGMLVLWALRWVFV
jgi:branched-subunit amino acid transport protein